MIKEIDFWIKKKGTGTELNQNRTEPEPTETEPNRTEPWDSWHVRFYIFSIFIDSVRTGMTLNQNWLEPELDPPTPPGSWGVLEHLGLPSPFPSPRRDPNPGNVYAPPRGGGLGGVKVYGASQERSSVLWAQRFIP